MTEPSSPTVCPSPLLTRSTTLTLDKRPAFLRFCNNTPTSSLVVSTYQLECASVRSGSLHFIADYSNSTLIASAQETRTQGGVFRFAPFHEHSLIAALTTGRLAIVSTADFSIKESAPLVDAMLLDVAPSPSASPTHALASTNSGALLLVDIDRWSTVARWDAHALPWTNEPCEVWTCEMAEDAVACSGGEDAVLKVWDMRATQRPASQIKQFTAGVTFIQALDEKTLLTGSYDDCIRKIDLRAPKHPVHQVQCAGGVWHVERWCDGWIASCMYGGWMMLDSQLNPIAENKAAGEALLYGCGVSANGKAMAYCTFNDYTLTVTHLDSNSTWQDAFPIST